MKIAVFDCFSGISGDMTVGAFLNAGLPFDYLKRKLGALKVKGYSLNTRKVQRGFLTATKFDVRIQSPKHGHRHVAYRQIDQLIRSSRLEPKIKKIARDIFSNLAKAEARIHGIHPARVHFHEVGAVDSIIDIVGTAIAVQHFDISKGYVSQLVDGQTTGSSSGHHRFPVPAPASFELLKGFELTRSKQAREMITPTGAAIIATLCEPQNENPVSYELETLGYGAGDYDDPDLPNCTRISIGILANHPKKDRVLLLETNIDDMPPFAFELLYQRLFKAGALDVFVESILMKKMRPAFKLSVLLPLHLQHQISEVILKESPTLGVRFFETERFLLDRKRLSVKTALGKIRMKAAFADGKIIKAFPEYEDLKRIAARTRRPLAQVYRLFVGASGARPNQEGRPPVAPTTLPSDIN